MKWRLSGKFLVIIVKVSGILFFKFIQHGAVKVIQNIKRKKNPNKTMKRNNEREICLFVLIFRGN